MYIQCKWLVCCAANLTHMAFDETTERQMIERLLDSLRALPEVQAELDEGLGTQRVPDRGYDARVDLRVGGRPLILLIEAKKSLYPRDVRQALWQLRATERQWPQNGQDVETVPMLIAKMISRRQGAASGRAGRLLRQRG